MGKVIRPFCWHQIFVPRGLSAPAQGLYTCIKSWKKLYKIHKWMKWQDISVDIKTLPPGGGLPFLGARYMYKIMKKKLYKIRLRRDFFETCNKVTRCSCRYQNSVPEGLSAPAPGLYTCTKSWKKSYKIRLQRVLLNKWPNWQEVSVDIKILSPGVVCPWPTAIYIY